MADNNDFDEWLDDVETDDDGELDQLNIDALLSAVDDDDDDSQTDSKAEPAGSELDQTNIDALLGISNDTPGESDAMGELDQDNIDALLNGTDDAPAPEAKDTNNGDIDELDQDNIDALLSGNNNDDIEELDQDNIDALFSGSDDTPAPEVKDTDNGDIDELDQDNIDALLSGNNNDDIEELDQDNIDALLSGSDDTPAPPEELDQDNIDALLSGTDDTPTSRDAAEASAETDQDNIDALFNDIDAATSGEIDQNDDGEDQSLDELFAESDTGEETSLSTEAADEMAETAFDSEFDEMDQLFSELEVDSSGEDDPFQAEEIDFAEMLDSSPHEGDDEFLSLGDDDDEEDEFAMQPDPEDHGDETDISALLTADDDDETKADDEPKKGIVIPAFISDMSKATMSAIGGGLALLLIFGLYFMISGDDSQVITIADKEISQEEKSQTPATPPENFIPLAQDNAYTMAEDGRELTLELQGSDEDGQPLLYEITNKPSHGRLSGTAPHFTYLANSDFPGEDSFEYTVNDGVDSSAIAHITITGPNLKGLALAQKIAKESQKEKIIAKEIKPKKPVVLAKNVHFYTNSTTPITVNWRRIWQEANKSDYDPKIHVEIVKKEGAGSLGKVSGSSTLFTPDPYSVRTDLIYYRFKKNGFRSATKTISVDISLGNPAPEINLAELKKGYLVGQKVSMDVSASRDDAPESLQFTWKQTSGSPVSMNVHDNGNKMAFVMPSSFYNKEMNGPIFRVTATDKTGKTTSKEITTISISRRQAALWRGNNGGVAEDPALEGQYFPWPYDD